LATGYVAALVQVRFAPVGLFPLLLGVVTGLAVAAVFSMTGGDGRRLRFLSATGATLLALASVHYGSYLQAKAASDEEMTTFEQMQRSFPQANLLQNLPRPLGGFGEYVRRELDIGRKLGPLPIEGSWLVLWWLIDGLLVWVGATVTALMLGERRVAAATSESPPSSPSGGVA
jgi:hypothetical protein